MTDEKVTADEIIAAMREADAKKKSGKGGSALLPTPDVDPPLPDSDVTAETGGRVSREWTFSFNESHADRSTHIPGSFIDPEGRRVALAGTHMVDLMLAGLNATHDTHEGETSPPVPRELRDDPYITGEELYEILEALRAEHDTTRPHRFDPEKPDDCSVCHLLWGYGPWDSAPTGTSHVSPVDLDDDESIPTKGPSGMCGCEPKFQPDRGACILAQYDDYQRCGCRCHHPRWSTDNPESRNG